MIAMTRLDRIASVQARIGWKALTADEYVDDGYVFLSTPNIKTSAIDFDDVNYISKFRYEESPELKLQTGDVLLAKDGSTLGIANCVRILPRPSTVNGSIAVLRLKSGDPRFLMYWLQGQPIQTQIEQVKDGMGVPHLFQRDIRKLAVPDLAPDYQQRIADFLDDRVSRIDRIISARREQVTLSAEAFDARWDEEMSQLADRYPTVPMRRVLSSIVDGPFGSSLTSQHYSDSGTRVVRLGNIGVASFRDHDKAFISDEYAMTLSNHAVEPGDLVMAGLGDERWPLGRCAVVPDIGPAIVKADCYRIRLTVGVDHEFAAVALSSPSVRSKMAILGRGATRARLNTEVAREAPVVVPPLDVQRDWTQQWHRQRGEVEQMSHAFTRSINLLTEYKSSLITAAVTGDLDVSTAGSNIPG